MSRKDMAEWRTDESLTRSETCAIIDKLIISIRIITTEFVELTRREERASSRW